MLDVNYRENDDNIDNKNNFVFFIQNDNESFTEDFSKELHMIIGDTINKMNGHVKTHDIHSLFEIFKNDLESNIQNIRADRTYSFDINFYYDSSLIECYHQTTSGNPYEYEIKISNMLDADKWLYCACCVSVHHRLEYKCFKFSFVTDDNKNIILMTSIYCNDNVKSKNEKEFYHILGLVYHNCVEIKYI